jgi:NAD+ diphosphatase
MPFSLFDAPTREASHFLGFAGNIIDRQSEKRSDDSALKALAEPDARLLLVASGRLLLDFSGGSPNPYFTLAKAEAVGAQTGEAILLGRADDIAMLALPLAAELEGLPEHLKAIDFRSILAQRLVDEAGLGALAQAAACGTEHFPRTDPVAIMLTVSGDKCLMGRGRHFAPGVYSALAGFIEPGETIEAAVRRETLEEAGIRLGRVVYHSSQPWPFPYSLMIGCYGEALNEDVSTDADELEDCRWFPRAEVLQMLDGAHPGALRVPPGHAIAHQLIRTWAEDA